MERSHLTEPNVSIFLGKALKECHIVKERYYNTMFNIIGFVVFICIVALILIYKYKGKLTPIEKKQKEEQKRQYILERIKNFRINKLKNEQQLITGLPHFEPHIHI